MIKERGESKGGGITHSGFALTFKTIFYSQVAPSDTSTGDEMNSLISGSGYSPYYKPYPPATYPMPAPPPSRTPREGSRSRSAAATTTGQRKNKLKLHRVGIDWLNFYSAKFIFFLDFLCRYVIAKSVIF